MEDIGQVLRQARESRGITLEEAAEATKIRQTYLEAIENGRWDMLPAPVYARGFIRSYADFLGLNGTELLRRSGWQQPSTEQSPPSPVSEPPVPPNRFRGRYSLSQLTAAAVILAALAGGYWAVKEREAAQIPPATEPQPLPNSGGIPAPASPPAPPTPPQDASPPELKVVKRTASQFTAEVKQVDQVEVSLRVEDHPCWVEARADGKVVERRTLEPGENRTFRADQEMQIIAGRASSLTVKVNGRQLDPVETNVFTYTIRKSAS